MITPPDASKSLRRMGLAPSDGTAIERNEFAKGLANMRDAFAEVEHTGWPYPKFEDAFALAFAGLEQIVKALEIINKAVATADKRPFSSWNFPELLRVRGELLLQQGAEGSIQATEDCFGHAAPPWRTSRGRCFGNFG